jgi:hypothetical protein
MRCIFQNDWEKLAGGQLVVVVVNGAVQNVVSERREGLDGSQLDHARA